MAYIVPNSTIELCNVPNYTPDLSDAPLFSTMQDQYNWFHTYTWKTYTAQSYVRKASNTLRVECLPTEMRRMMSTNYMLFRNNSYETKWFYAFVTATEYVNDHTMNVFFSIDPIQSWFTLDQASLGQSFVAREHVADDTIGSNLEPEPVQTGEMICSYGRMNHISSPYDETCIIMAVTQPVSGTTASGHVINGSYSGCTLYAFTMGQASNINSLISSYAAAGKSDAIVGMWIAPKGALVNTNYGGEELTGPLDGQYTTQEGTTIENSSFLYTRYINGKNTDEGYWPRNNKLYTYPYTFYRLFTRQGNYADFRYEFFRDFTPRFDIIGTVMMPVTMTAKPYGYKQTAFTTKTSDGSTYKTVVDTDMEGVTVTGYPVCNWSNDSFAAWMAQNSVPMANTRHAQEATNDNSRQAVYTANKIRDASTDANNKAQLANGLVGMLGAASELNLGGVASAGISAVVNTLNNTYQTGLQNAQALNSVNTAIANSEIALATSQQNATYQASLLADTQGGTLAGGSLAAAMDMRSMGTGLAIWGIQMQPAYERLVKIDQYFDMFGYAVNSVKVPELTSRQYWNYVKTVNADVRGTMPSQARQDIKDLLDRGIRFWHDPDKMGNYSYHNSIVS